MERKILIDPGHDRGKYNQGAICGYWEGERMWALSGYLVKALADRKITAGTTKKQCDQTLEVTTRGRMAMGYGALISLHSNACADPMVDRPVGIHLVDDDCGDMDEESRALAVALSNTVAKVMDTSPAEVYSRKSTRDRDGDGQRNDDYYGVLYGAHQVGVPAVILEISFHTNEAAARWLMADENLRKLAEALADAVEAHYDERDCVEVNMKTIGKGDQGPQVAALQALLIGFGYDCGMWGTDGKFGGKTEEALRKYQSRHSLEPDGIAGPKSWAVLLGQ